MTDARSDTWLDWLGEAHVVIKDWEERRDGPLLSVSDAAKLAEAIAHGLERAFDRGKASA